MLKLKHDFVCLKAPSKHTLDMMTTITNIIIAHQIITLGITKARPESDNKSQKYSQIAHILIFFLPIFSL